MATHPAETEWVIVDCDIFRCASAAPTNDENHLSARIRARLRVIVKIFVILFILFAPLLPRNVLIDDCFQNGNSRSFISPL